MCEQTEIDYLDGDIVWVKLGSCFWPGEVVGPEKLPPDVLPSFRKPPIAVVKFFQEDTYEYVKSLASIYKYNCSRKNEFINKGLYMYRTKHGHMEKFPEDVIRAETAVGGDIKILTRDEFQETKKESYAGLFSDPAKKTPVSDKKGRSRGRPSESSKLSTPMKKFKEKSNYKVHILLQGSKTPNQTGENASTPSTSRAGSEPSDVTEKQEEINNDQTKKPQTFSTFSTPTMSSSGIYACHACPFTTTRLNVLILHTKSHSVTFTPYTPSPVKKKQVKTPKSTPASTKTPKQKKPRQEKIEKAIKSQKSPSQKRTGDPEITPEIKKAKTDAEIKNSLLADWDDGDDESNDESTIVMAASPEVPVAAESPAVPTPAELPSALVPTEEILMPEKKSDEQPSPDKPEASSDSKYEFCEDEDWPVEADIGRKIPRVKNPSKRKSETKSVSIDEDDMAREVAELLNKTAVPELPSAPEPLKVEENFPQPSIVKSPDKKTDISQDTLGDEKKSLTDPQPHKTIFKTKTFFRSRHSRSQDAIGKYVAEQLNAAERMDIAESELNGAELAPSPEIRASPPIEPVKVARLAPKIQFKKIKAEAAQLRELEKLNNDKLKDNQISTSPKKNLCENLVTNVTSPAKEETKIENVLQTEFIAGSDNLKINDKSSLSLDYPNIDIEEICTGKADSANLNSEIVNEVKEKLSDIKADIVKEEADLKSLTENKISKTFESFMNESTASAVDALLSVSRDTDRVTKVISDDPPEDLFEDDIKDNLVSTNMNGHNEPNVENNEIEENIVKVMDNETTYNPETQLSQNVIPVELTIPEDETSVNTDGIEITDSDSQKTVYETTVCIPDTQNAETEKNTKELISDVTYVEKAFTEQASSETSNNFSLESIPSESDLQIAEALINLPTTTLQNKGPVLNQNENSHLDAPLDNIEVSGNEDIFIQKNENIIEEEVNNSINVIESPDVIVQSADNTTARFETEQEKSENLNAAQSLVQMSETIDHNIKIPDLEIPNNDAVNVVNVIEDQILLSPKETEQNCITDIVDTKDFSKSSELETKTPKLLKILEEPYVPKLSATKKSITKQIIIPGKEKILNIDAGKIPLKAKPQQLSNQKIIIRRTTPNKNLLNNITEVSKPDKIILSRSNKGSQDGSIQTYTIKTTQDQPKVGDKNTIIIQPKIRKISKPLTKLQKIKPQQSSIVVTDNKIIQGNKKDEAMFDINSMPIVISDELLTPESIEKMPIVMSDGNLITNTNTPPKLVKTKQILVENEKPKPDVKTLLVSSHNEVSKVSSPNILTKSSKLRGSKHMLVIEKTTGKQKFIMTKAETTLKETSKPPQTLIQPITQSVQKPEKFIILPTQSSPRPGRTQKIVIDPQTGKAHVLIGKAPEPTTTTSENKPVSAKLVPSASDATTPGNTVMIITNAQGSQSRIVLTPEHEKILFPNKNQPNVSQIKSFTNRVLANAGSVQKTVMSAATATKTQTRIVPKQKNTIITPKGQLIVGGRIATTAQNIAPLPEIRPKRILASEPKKLVQAIQKNASEPLIFLQQKSGTVMQLTAAQFEHLQKTGQIIQKSPASSQENKTLVQKSITICPSEAGVPTIQKQRVRKLINESPTPPKKLKQEIAIAPALVPSLTPISSTIAPPQVPNISSTTSNVSVTNYLDVENLEEVLPSTVIARQESLAVPPQEFSAPTLTTPIPDGQLLAVPLDFFGGPQGAFYLCMEDNGKYNIVDNRPLVLHNNQLVPMAEPLPTIAPQPERRDILEAALANSEVFNAQPQPIVQNVVQQIQSAREPAHDYRDFNANVPVNTHPNNPLRETSTTLHQPIMTPVEVPTNIVTEPLLPSNLEDGLAVIGVTPDVVQNALDLPITVTDPRIAPKTKITSKSCAKTHLTSTISDMTYVKEECPAVGPISMPLLTDDEEAGGKSMPILTDEVTERTVSSVESTIGSPSSTDVRESENEESGQWSRRLLTPCSDTSEVSAEIPLQPVMQLSVNDLSHNS